jgi:hypothetical protein
LYFGVYSDVCWELRVDLLSSKFSNSRESTIELSSVAEGISSCIFEFCIESFGFEYKYIMQSKKNRNLVIQK